MEDDELEGEFILGWPDRKRLTQMTSVDAEGRVVYARSPILGQMRTTQITSSYYQVRTAQITSNYSRSSAYGSDNK